jgi:hypothetical protein
MGDIEVEMGSGICGRVMGEDGRWLFFGECWKQEEMGE